MTVFLRVEACVDQEALLAKFQFSHYLALIGAANSHAESFWGETGEWSPRAKGKGSRIHETRYLSRTLQKGLMRSDACSS